MSMLQREASAYQTTGNYSGAMYADPHALITQMFDGALQRLAQAKGAMARGDVKQKGETIGKAIGIIGGLDGCLDHDKGGELSQNLASLYEYMNVTLAQANICNDVTKLDEVSGLLTEIKSAWLQVPAQRDRNST
ncbi:MAG: flagellar export chaperone FliS [Gammaproteobacteria bacterium]|nr:flagellar export chaperone FliS [Gammaproteobacteria bacterium]